VIERGGGSSAAATIQMQIKPRGSPSRGLVSFCSSVFRVGHDRRDQPMV